MTRSIQETIKTLSIYMMAAGEEIDAAGFPDHSWSDDMLTTDLLNVDRLKRDWNQIQTIVLENSDLFPSTRAVSTMNGIILGLSQRYQVTIDILRERSFAKTGTV